MAALAPVGYIGRVRSVVYRYEDLAQLLGALDAARGQALPLPAGAHVRDGEWVLALFELGASPRATAAAGKGVLLEEGLALVFERRDWERLRQFAAAGVAPQPKARPPEPPSAAVSLRRTQAWEAVPQPSSREEPAADVEPPTERTAVPLVSDETLAEPVPRPHEGRSRVLLVEDDTDLREVVAAMLETVGLQVSSVGSAEDALEAVVADAPDLLVLDWNLPGMSGLELCKVLRADPRVQALPVLFLTAHAATQDMVDAFAAGADDYVVKPFRAAELGARIFGLLRRTRRISVP